MQAVPGTISPEEGSNCKSHPETEALGHRGDTLDTGPERIPDGPRRHPDDRLEESMDLGRG